MNRIRGAAVLGLMAGLALRPLLRRVLMVRLGRDVGRINEGDYRPFLDAYAEDAVLYFNDGQHRWAGDHRGKPAIEGFLRDFVAAGLKVELKDLWLSGPPWDMTVIGRVDDEAGAPGGELLYSNRVGAPTADPLGQDRPPRRLLRGHRRRWQPSRPRCATSASTRWPRSGSLKGSLQL